MYNLHLMTADLDAIYESGEVTRVSVEPDMGLFPPAAERAMRFLCSYAIEEAIKTTSGPIEITTVGAGFPWMAEMQVNEHAKRCDSVAKKIAGEVNQAVNNFDFGTTPYSAEEIRQTKHTLQQPFVKNYVRSVMGDVLFAPPDEVTQTGIKPGRRNRFLAEHFTRELESADALVVRVHEPIDESYRGKGGWELLTKVSAEPLFAELVGRLGTVEQAQDAIKLVGRLCAGFCPAHLRPFKVNVLDIRSHEDLMAQAEVIFDDHPSIKDTELYARATALAMSHTVQTADHDLSSLDDGSANVIIVSHWPLRHTSTGDYDDAGWAFLLHQLSNKLMMNGIAIFFPWSMPRTFDAGHRDVTLGGVQSMMTNDYGLELRIASEPTEDLLNAIAVFGQEPAILAPQMRNGGNIGRLIARKYPTLKEILA